MGLLTIKTATGEGKAPVEAWLVALSTVIADGQGPVPAHVKASRWVLQPPLCKVVEVVLNGEWVSAREDQWLTAILRRLSRRAMHELLDALDKGIVSHRDVAREALELPANVHPRAITVMFNGRAKAAPLASWLGCIVQGMRGEQRRRVFAAVREVEWRTPNNQVMRLAEHKTNVVPITTPSK